MNTELRILHLEDNASDAKLIHALLREQDIACDIERVQTRENFMSALAHGKHDLILSDFSLPDFDGLSALMLAHEKRPDLPFIFISGILGEEVAVESLKLGATDYVLKDRPSRLGAAIRRAMENTKEKKELRRAEEAMVQSEYKYRQVFECLSEAAILADAQTGKVLDANRQAEVLLHRTRGEIIGSNQKNFLTRATQEQYLHRLAGSNGQSSSRITFDGEVVSKEGQIVPVDVSAAPMNLYGHRLILGLYHPRISHLHC